MRSLKLLQRCRSPFTGEMGHIVEIRDDLYGWRALNKTRRITWFPKNMTFTELRERRRRIKNAKDRALRRERKANYFAVTA